MDDIHGFFLYHGAVEAFESHKKHFSLLKFFFKYIDLANFFIITMSEWYYVQYIT